MGYFAAGDLAEQFDFTLTIDGVDKACSLKIPNDEFWDAVFQSVVNGKKALVAWNLPPIYVNPGDSTTGRLPDGSLMSIAADGGIFRDGNRVKAKDGTIAAGQLMLVYGNTVGVKGKTSGVWLAINATTGVWSAVDGDPAIWR